MKSCFKDLVVFITGGAGGIGSAIARAFVECGSRVAICDINHDAGVALSAEIGCDFFAADVCSAESLAEVFRELQSRYGGVDIVVNNVGVSEFCPFEELSLEDFDRVLATNLRPVLVTSKLLISERMDTPARYGRIINISSTRYAQSEAGSEAYAASKGGIVALTHALALSFSRYNITVNCISPGWIECGDYQALSAVDHSQHPSGRVGRPADIARAVLFLADPANDFVNGENIVIDGGMSRKMIYEE